MANYLITGSRNNTPHITSMDDASLNAGIFGNGAYILNRGEKLRAEMTTPNNCRIYDGDIVTQGRHSRIETSSYIDLTVSNGTVGMKRNDLVVARYESDVETGIESVDFVVIQGTPSANPTDPEYNEGNIFDGDLIVDFPIYRIKLDGITVGTPERICAISESLSDIEGTTTTSDGAVWKYRKLKSGAVEAWLKAEFQFTNSPTENGYSYLWTKEYELPSGLFASAPSHGLGSTNTLATVGYVRYQSTASKVKLYIASGFKYTSANNCEIYGYFHS